MKKTKNITTKIRGISFRLNIQMIHCQELKNIFLRVMRGREREGDEGEREGDEGEREGECGERIGIKDIVARYF
jgi:hypothetical protein